MDRVLRKLRSSMKQNRTIMGKERKYRNASVLIPLVEINKEVQVLFQVRAEHIRQGGEIGFPGGMSEKVDHGSYQATAIRETVEELGIKEEEIDMVGYLGCYVAHSDVTIDVYVGVLKISDIDHMAFSEEVAEVFTVPLKKLQEMTPEVHTINMRIQQSFMDEEGDELILLDAKALGLPDKYQKPYYNRKRKVYFYRYGGHTIWGMTGEILYEFLKVI